MELYPYPDVYPDSETFWNETEWMDGIDQTDYYFDIGEWVESLGFTCRKDDLIIPAWLFFELQPSALSLPTRRWLTFAIFVILSFKDTKGTGSIEDLSVPIAGFL